MTIGDLTDRKVQMLSGDLIVNIVMIIPVFSRMNRRKTKKDTFILRAHGNVATRWFG